MQDDFLDFLNRKTPTAPFFNFNNHKSESFPNLLLVLSTVACLSSKLGGTCGLWNIYIRFWMKIENFTWRSCSMTHAGRESIYNYQSIIIFESQFSLFLNGAHGKVRKIHKTESQLSHSAAVNELWKVIFALCFATRSGDPLKKIMV